jgi:hypothetical protein
MISAALRKRGKIIPGHVLYEIMRGLIGQRRSSTNLGSLAACEDAINSGLATLEKLFAAETN